MGRYKRCVVMAFYIGPLEDHLDAVPELLTDVILDVHREPRCDFYALHGRRVFIEA